MKSDVIRVSEAIAQGIVGRERDIQPAQVAAVAEWVIVNRVVEDCEYGFWEALVDKLCHLFWEHDGMTGRAERVVTLAWANTYLRDVYEKIHEVYQRDE
jgi:hypothetical protein